MGFRLLDEQHRKHCGILSSTLLGGPKRHTGEQERDVEQIVVSQSLMGCRKREEFPFYE